MRFWTSDLHFGHANIIGYSGRPYQDVEEMNDDLVSRWNDVVGASDEVMVLGDFTFERHNLYGRVHSLAGEKILVRGNHDRHSTAHYIEAGFQDVWKNCRMQIGRHHVVVNHYPYRGDVGAVDRNPEKRPMDRGNFLLHGHVHEKWRMRGRQINCGVDAWGGYPVPEAHLERLMNEGPQELRPLPW